MKAESTITDFDIISKLGEGSFAQVYKVKRLSDGKLYAMKKVKMSLMSAKERENALNEIRILASLSSPYIVEYKDSFLDPEMSILCVIMEFASGGDLTKMVNEGKLKGGVDEAELWRALTQMTLGLKALHDLKILHRDLKCANVFTLNTPQGIVYKLGDLNISKVTKGAAAKTQAGTPYYAAPEVWRGELYNSPCDIWSMGCIIYELAAGRPPFRANDLQGLNQKIQKGVYDPLPAKYSKDLIAIISTMLRVPSFRNQKLNPSTRPTCAQILNNPTVIKNSGTLLISSEQSSSGREMLLQTIKLPRNLHLLKGNLPKSKYDDNVEYGRASSAAPRKPPELIEQTPQPEKSKVQQQLQQQPAPQLRTPVAANGRPPQPAQRPPLQQQKPPNQVKQDYSSLQQKIQIQEQRLVGTPQQSERSNNYQRVASPSRGSQQSNQYYQRPAAGQPSGMGRRQVSAHQVGRR